MKAACLAAILLITGASAQPSPSVSLEVAGVVLETGTNHGVEGAIVVLNQTGLGGPDALNLDTVTDSAGAFRFQIDRPANVSVSARKNGYTSAGASVWMGMDTPRPKEGMRLFISRQAEITGRIEDWETREPVPNFSRLSLGVSRFGEAPLLVTRNGDSNSTTDEEGRFVIAIPPLGKVAVWISPQLWYGERHLPRFSEGDLDVVDQDYKESYWPGGSGSETALPVQAVSGARMEVGTIRVRRVPYYRARMTLGAVNCEPGTRFVARLSREAQSGARLREGQINATCGQNFLLRGLKPGWYRLDVIPASNTPVEDQLWAFASFEVMDRNLSVTADLQRGADIVGRVISADGAAKLPSGTRVTLSRVGGSTQQERRETAVDEEGRFRFINVPRDAWRVGLVGLSLPFLISEVRFRGVPLGVNPFSWDGAGSLELEVDDQPASITGVASVKDVPLKSAIVTLFRSPPPSNGYGGNSAMDFVPADDQGRFRFDGLAPGEYRVLVLPPDGLLWLDGQPEARDRLAGRGEKVTITRGSSQQLQVKLIQ